MRFLRLLISVLICQFLLLDNVCTATSSTNSVQELSPSAREVAKDIGLLDLLDDLLAARDEAKRTTNTTMSLESLSVRDEIYGLILATLLEVRETISKIDDDILRTHEILTIVDEKTEKRVVLSEVLNFINSGIAEVISTGVGLSANSLRVPAAAVGAYGGGAEILISLITLKLQHSGHLSQTLTPNMLSKIYGYDHADMDYPDAVWHYLNDPSPKSLNKESRIDYLKSRWRDLGYTKPRKKEIEEMRAAILTGTATGKKKLTATILQNRLSMLSDLRNTIACMDRDMSEIVHWVLTILYPKRVSTSYRSISGRIQ